MATPANTEFLETVFIFLLDLGDACESCRRGKVRYDAIVRAETARESVEHGGERVRLIVDDNDRGSLGHSLALQFQDHADRTTARLGERSGRDQFYL